MPLIQREWQRHNDNPYIVEQLNYSSANQEILFDDKFSKLNAEQRDTFDKIYKSTSDRNGDPFFLHGPGGTGKMFVYSTVCHHIRANLWIVLCVASFSVASLLLLGGHTAHSTFCIPVHGLCSDSWCQIDKKSKHADML
jgi:PIF1-like helicase